MKVTQKEYDFLMKVSTSDYANESWRDEECSIGDWVGDWGYDMRVVRGLMSSLQEKKVVELREDYDYEETWVSIHRDYLDTENEKLINLEVA